MGEEFFPRSIRLINDLDDADKEHVYRALLPDWLFERYGVDRERLTFEGQRVVKLRAPKGTRAMELIVRRRASDIDPMLYLNMADTFNQQILVLLVVVNDPDAPRFNIDRDLDGNDTQLGTTSRNIPAEIAAMEAGLAPGQIRPGLRVFKQLVPLFEDFIRRMQHDLFLIEPLSYHNAIVFERYGFSYSYGFKDMQEIDREFRPGGWLNQKLNDSTPFRRADAWKTVRGRAWAIHDGILGHPFTGFQMYKRIGIHAGVNTFPDSMW